MGHSTACRHWKVFAPAIVTVLLCVLPAGLAQEEADAATKKLMAANGLFHRGLFKLAAQEYAEFLTAYPQSPQVSTARYGQAISHYRLGEHEKAAGMLAEVLKDAKFAQRDEALAVLGHCRFALKSYDQALSAFDELLAKHPGSEHAELAALNRAQVLLLKGDAKSCLTACQSFIEKNPSSPRRATAEYFLALAQHGLGQYPQACATLGELLKRPNSPYELDAALLLGQCLEAQGKTDQAVEQYRSMVKKAPPARQGEGLYSLGVALYKTGKYAEAGAELAQVVAKHASSPCAPPARLQLGLAQFADNKPAEARKTLAGVAKDDAARALVARYWLAQCDMAEKDYASARSALDALARSDPPHPNAEAIAYDRAVCAMELGKHADAAGEFADFRRQWPKSERLTDAAYRQAFCLHRLGKYPESLQLCQQVAQAPASGVTAAAAELAAEDLILMRKYPEAAKAFSALAKTARSDEQKLRVSLRLGQCAHLSGEYAAAIAILKPLAADAKLSAGPEFQDVLLVLGDALLQAGQHKEAAETLARYVAIAKGGGEEARFKLALAQLRSGDAASAEKSLSALMAGPAESPWVLRAAFEYGQLAYRSGQAEKAAPALAKVAAAGAPEELAAHAAYLLAWMDYDAKKYPEAAARFGQVVQKYPKNPLSAEAAFHRAACLHQAGQAAQALALFQEYVKSQPQGKYALEARHLTASCLVKLNKHPEAAEILAALAADKNACTDAVLYELAWSQRESKAPEAAAAAYRRLLGEFPNSKLSGTAQAELAELYYAQDKYDLAGELLEKVVAAGGDEKALAAARYRLGFCHAKLDKHDKAAAAFEAFAAAHPKDDLAPSALYQAGVAYALLDKLPQAQQQFSALLTRHAEHELAGVAALKLGEVQNTAGEYDKAAATYAAFLEKRPKDPLAYLAQFGIGWSLENRKKHDEARQWYARVIAAHNGPTAARAQFQTGECYFAEGKFDQAARELLKVEIVYAYPEWSARALYEAGRAFEQLAQPDQAKSQYAACVGKYKDTPPAALAEKRLKLLEQPKP